MTVGESALYSGESYIGFGRETTFGTYATASAGLDFISASIKTVKDSKVLEQIERKRTMAKSFSLGKTIEGDVEAHASADITAMAYILQNAFGGTVTSATATGETTGSTAIVHTFSEGSLDQSYTALSVNHRKGPSSSGRIWRYLGGRVDSLELTAELDEPLKYTASLAFKDSTQTADDVESLFTATAWEPLSFADGRLSVENSFASLTSSSFWHVQNINFSLANNLKTDAASRRIGSDVPDVIAIGVQNYELSCQIRFDTTTAYDAMIAHSEFAAEFEFQGSTLSGSTGGVRRGLKFQFQKLTVKDAGDPEISGPDETLVSTVTFNVLRDESAAGYAVRAQLTNDMASI